MKQDVQKISFNSVIENEYEEELYRKIAQSIIDYIENNGPASFNTLNKYVGGSDRRVLRLLDEMVKHKILVFENNMFITPDYTSTPFSAKDTVCPKCNGTLVAPDSCESIITITHDIFEKRPKPTFVFDQRPVTFETTINRVRYAIWRNDIRNKRVAILGDDDLTSIPLALTKLPSEVIVFEIDKRLVNFINDVAKSYKLKLKAIQCDLTKPLPSRYIKYFDVFMCDPTPTRVPFTIFVNQGIGLLGENGIGYISMYSSCLNKNMNLQSALNNMQVLITDMIPFFTEYAYVKETYSENDMKLLNKYANGRSDISFNETLVRFEMTNTTKKINLSFSKKDILGKATKRVMKSPLMDPAIALGSEADKSYLLSVLRKVSK